MENGLPLREDIQREEFYFFMIEMLSFGGILLCIYLGLSLRETIPETELVFFAMAFIFCGLITERSIMFSSFPVRVRQYISLIGPSFILCIMLILGIFENFPYLLTPDDLVSFVEFAAFVFGFWIVGAGIKRVIVRARFQVLYQRRIEQIGKVTFRPNRRLLLGTIIFAIALSTFIYFFDNEDFLEIVGTMLVFVILINCCMESNMKREEKHPW